MIHNNKIKGKTYLFTRVQFVNISENVKQTLALDENTALSGFSIDLALNFDIFFDFSKIFWLACKIIDSNNIMISLEIQISLKLKRNFQTKYLYLKLKTL